MNRNKMVRSIRGLGALKETKGDCTLLSLPEENKHQKKKKKSSKKRTKQGRGGGRVFGTMYTDLAGKTRRRG